MPDIPWFLRELSPEEKPLEDRLTERTSPERRPRDPEGPKQRPYQEPGPIPKRIAFGIVGAAIEVHRHLRAGHSERVYERALAIELEHRGIAYETQVPVDVNYRGIRVGESRIDMIVEGLIIVELKVVERLTAVHTIQALSYLAATELPLALLINFNVAVLTTGVHRVLPFAP